MKLRWLQLIPYHNFSFLSIFNLKTISFDFNNNRQPRKIWPSSIYEFSEILEYEI